MSATTELVDSTNLRSFPPTSVVALDASRDRLIRASACGRAPVGIWWLASSRTKSAAYYTGPAARTGIEVNVQSGDVTIVGGSQVGVFVNRTDHSVFGHGPREQVSFAAASFTSSRAVRRSSSAPACQSYRSERPR